MQYCCLGKYGPYPAVDGPTSGHLVWQGKSALVLDLGCGTLPRLMELSESLDVCGIVLTHLHPDHYSDALVYAQYLAKCAEKPLPLFLPQNPVRISSLLEDTGVFEIHYSSADLVAQCGPFTLKFAPTVHPMPGFAVRVEGEKSLAYTGDSLPTKALSLWAQEADVLLCDAPFISQTVPENSPHMTAEQAAQIAKQAHVKQLYLSHITPGTNPDDLLQAASKEFDQVRLVEEMKIQTIA